jgi:hypothetical protein
MVSRDLENGQQSIQRMTKEVHGAGISSKQCPGPGSEMCGMTPVVQSCHLSLGQPALYAAASAYGWAQLQWHLVCQGEVCSVNLSCSHCVLTCVDVPRPTRGPHPCSWMCWSVTSARSSKQWQSAVTVPQ